MERLDFETFRRSRLERLDLRPGTIQLWCAPLDPSTTTVASLEQSLSTDERERAGRFRFDKHRRQYVVSRGLLRHLLAGYLGRRPAALTFVYGPKGKPDLAEPEDQELQFNVAHSGERVLIGFTLARPIGVDIEEVRPMPDAEAIAKSFFSAVEAEALQGVREAQKDETFFNCWTRKEAYIKAIGDGLSVPLDRFDLTLLPGEEARMLSLDGDPAKAESWALRHLQPANGYIGALAIEDHGRSIDSWRLDLDRLRY